MDMGMLQGAIVGLKTAGDLAMTLGKLHTMTEVQSKVIELQQVILSAQSGALGAQSEQFALLEKIRALEQEIACVKAWGEQKQRYSLAQPWIGAVVYALKKESSNAEPAHWICTTCYESGRKSIFNDLQINPRTVGLGCPVCKTHIPSGWGGGALSANTRKTWVGNRDHDHQD